MNGKLKVFAACTLVSAMCAGAGSAWADMSGRKNVDFYSIPPTLKQSIPPNVLLNLSVETPMGGAAYNDHTTQSETCTGRPESKVGNCFNAAETYLGYFDPAKCYDYHGASEAYLDTGSWEIEADSEEMSVVPSHPATNAIDNDFNTFWHTRWKGETPIPKHPHELVIYLGGEESFDGLLYVPRQSGLPNGNVSDYEIYVSDTAEFPPTAVATGTFSYSPDERDLQHVEFASTVTGSYVKFKAIGEHDNSGDWSSAAEIKLLAAGADTLSYFRPNGEVSAGSCGGKWSGNFLNWVSMTAIDEFIYAMTGGNRVRDDQAQVVVERARRYDGNDSWYPWKKLKIGENVSPSSVTPYNSHDEIWIYNTAYGFNVATTKDAAGSPSGDEYLGSFDVKVELCNSSKGLKGLESNCKEYSDGNSVWYKPEGLMQRNAHRMRFGVMAYSNVDNQEQDGGVLRSQMKFIGAKLPNGNDNPDAELRTDGSYIDNPESHSAGNSGVLNYLNKFHKADYKSYDPVSELFYECVNYYKDRRPTPNFLSGLGTAQGGFPVLTTWEDPIQYWCQSNFIIGINDANPWADKKLPGTSFNCPQDWNDCGEPDNADADIDVTALTNQIGQWEGRGNIGEVLAYAGGTRKNSNYIAGLAYYANTTDLRPDDAANGFREKQTVTTFMIDSQEYSASPNLGNTNVLWLAGKYGGFVDENGDGVAQQGEWDADNDGEPDNYVLATSPAKMIAALEKAFEVAAAGITSAQTAASITLNTRTGLGAVYQAAYVPTYQDKTDAANRVEWSGMVRMTALNQDGTLGSQLWDVRDTMDLVTAPTVNRTYDQADATKRYVFTWIDADDDGAVDDTEQMELTASNISAANYSYFDVASKLDMTEDEAVIRTQALVNYVRGQEQVGKRNRRADYDNDDVVENLLLGDIIHSTPVTAGPPAENLDLLYDDVTYADFKTAYKDRRHVVYVGANDGMLHAINAGFYNRVSGTYTHTSSGKAAHALGTELWAYAPYNLLPHLKWLESSTYQHVYFVDGAIKVFDAKIFPTGTNHPGGWGTVLAVGMRLGGAPSTVDIDDDGLGDDDDREFISAYLLLDVTNPESPPEVLAEIKAGDFDSGISYAFSEPGVFTLRKADETLNDWYLVFGNGPNSLTTITTDQTAKLFVYKLNHASRGFVTGFNPYVLDNTHIAFTGAVTTVDWDLNYLADDAYFGTVGADSASGKLYRLHIGEDSSPANWTVTEMLDVGGPVFTKPTVAIDTLKQHWVYAGSGRLETNEDALTTPQQYIFGIKDKAGASLPYAMSDLRDVSSVQVNADGSLTNGGSVDNFTDLELEIAGTSSTFGGWHRKLWSNGSSPSERALSRFSLLGGALFATSYIPDTDLCTLGSSYLYTSYYRTGTAHPDGILGFGDDSGTPYALPKVMISQGVAWAPALHIGEIPGVDGGPPTDKVSAIVQTSEGEIVRREADVPLATDSREISWRELGICY